MRDYEILYIVRPELTEEELAAAVQKVTDLIGNLGGTHQRTNVWGKRRLAYEVDHLREGYYVLTDFGLDQERVPELEATLKISDTVFRHQVVRKPKAAPAAAPPAEAATEPEGDVKAQAGAHDDEGEGPPPAEAEADSSAAAGEPETGELESGSAPEAVAAAGEDEEEPAP
ncbi:MAG: 30S ribosomal protein S6 [Candidatus Dormibacterales bacterium]